MRRLALSLALVLNACATTSPRFDQEVATTFAQDDMRKLETDDLELYYPAAYADVARQVAARAAECLRLMRARDLEKRDYGRAVLFLTSANYNNAYVGGQSGGEPLHSLNPLSVSAELFHYFGLGGANTGDIACHEMFHYVHYEQTHGFWRVVNAVVGPVVPPQAFLERWFTEGAAQFYEGRLGRAVGRPYSPFYRGSFDSFVALRGGHVSPGDLAISQRELNPFSGAYLTGLHFIEWLVKQYGEEKLWKLMDDQGHSVFSPFGTALRFDVVYGQPLGELIDTWEKELVATLVPRVRPVEERVLLEDVGQLARLAAHAPTGVTAIVSSGNEQVPLLRILEADGSLRVEKRLTMLHPGRAAVFVGPGTMSGLSFTADGKFLFLLNDDLISRGDTRAQIWKIDAQTGEVLKVFQDIGRGMAGSVSGDGRTFTFADFPPGRSRLIERDLETGTDVVLADFPPGVSVAAPAWNPSHTQLVFSRQDSNGWNLVLRALDGTSVDLTSDGAFNYGARWADDTHLVFSRTAGKYLQAWRLDLANPTVLERLSNAPYGVIDPSPAAGHIVLAARDGVHWSIDSVPTEPLEQLTVTPTEAPPPWHESPPLVVTSDEPYSPVDHLFVPQLRAPGVVGLNANVTLRPFSAKFNDVTLSLSLMGRDRLGHHTWAINGTLAVPTITDNTLQAGYRNLSLAPWAIIASASRQAYATEAFWSGGLFASRSFFTVPVFFGVQTEVWQPFGFNVEKFIGPTAAISYSAGDGTAYGGPSRNLSVSFDVAGYPRAFGSARDMVDLRADLGLAIPLPLSKRHSFFFSAVGRSLPGAPAGAMRVGGISSYFVFNQPVLRSPFPSTPSSFLPGSLVESLRGFDDYSLRAQHAGIFHVRYRYSFIIDRGFASLIYLFPSIFFRQVDVEAFGVAAITESQVARGAGAAIALRMNLGGVLPISLRYQFAWRFDFGLQDLHVFGVSFD